MVVVGVLAAALVAAASAGSTGADKLEARLHAMLNNADASSDTLNKLGAAGLTTVALWTSLADSKEKFRELLETDDVNVKSTNDDGTKSLPKTLEQAKVMGVWKACRASDELEVKTDAQRRLDRQPPTISEEDLDNCIKLFEAKKWPLPDEMCPSGAYLERKLGELESRFKAEPLTRVTNKRQEDINAAGNIGGLDTSNPQLLQFRIQKLSLIHI